jgi:hypothetical protein
MLVLVLVLVLVLLLMLGLEAETKRHDWLHVVSRQTRWRNALTV